jgi:hypothetical protein
MLPGRMTTNELDCLDVVSNRVISHLLIDYKLVVDSHMPHGKEKILRHYSMLERFCYEIIL